MPQTNQILKDRYQLSQLLGENASQQTWLATDLASEPQATVVVKLLAMSPQMQWDEAKLLEREAQILQKLDHPRIPRYRDYFMLDQLSDSRFPWFCLVQSHVPGHSLQQLLDQGQHFTEAEVEKIAIEVLSLLVYLHGFEPPLLHRDLKPSNLIWGTDDRLYLIDFGSVQDRAALEGATFTVVGTHGYVPMEQFGGQAVPASDLYALGATLIHLLTGTAPADLPHQNARIQFAQQVSIDPAFVNWVNQLTAPDLADRLSTARLALEALENRRRLSLPMVKRRPEGSCIQLKKTVHQLEITIPPRGWQAVSWLSCLSGFVSNWYVWFPLFILLLVFFGAIWGNWRFLITLAVGGAAILFKTLSPALKHTVIRADRTHLTFYWKLLGFTVKKQRLPILWIHPLFDLYEPKQWGSKGIAIQAGKDVLLTNPMAEVERHWVMQEIQDWLCSGGTVLPHLVGRIWITESADELVILYPGLYPEYPATEKNDRNSGWITHALRFSRDRFVCCYFRLGRTVELFSGSTEAICELRYGVYKGLVKNQDSIVTHLVIHTSSQTYAFGHYLSKRELDQIQQTINNWLQQIRHKG